MLRDTTSEEIARDAATARRKLMNDEQLEELRAAMDKLVRAVEEKLGPAARREPRPLGPD